MNCFTTFNIDKLQSDRVGVLQEQLSGSVVGGLGQPIDIACNCSEQCVRRFARSKNGTTLEEIFDGRLHREHLTTPSNFVQTFFTGESPA